MQLNRFGPKDFSVFRILRIGRASTVSLQMSVEKCQWVVLFTSDYKLIEHSVGITHHDIYRLISQSLLILRITSIKYSHERNKLSIGLVSAVLSKAARLVAVTHVQKNIFPKQTIFQQLIIRHFSSIFTAFV